MDKKTDCIEAMKTAIRLNPQDADALNYLGYIYAELSQNLEEAERLTREALKLKPDDGYIMDSLGWVLYKRNNISESLKYLREANNRQNDPSIAAHLGEVLWITGSKDEAKAVFEKALKDFPENEKLKETKKRFIP